MYICWSDGTVSSFFKIISFKWLGREGIGHPSLSVVPHKRNEQFLHETHLDCSCANELSSSQHVVASHPRLQVDGPVDDVKEDVRSRKDDPRVLVYGVCVYPDVHVTSGWLHLACDLWVIQCHLGQYSLLATTVLWHPIMSCGVGIYRPVASNLGVDHHLVWVANATCTRQLSKSDKKRKIISEKS